MTTSIIVTESVALTKTKAPQLPAAPVEYDRTYQDGLTNILRQYFNTIDNLIGQLNLSVGGTGAGVFLPNGAFHQDGNTTLTANITNVSTSPIAVASTASFLSAGALLIGTEIILYTGKTSTTFTGITRGAKGTTNVAHSSGAAVSEAQVVPSPTSYIEIPFTQTDISYGVSLDPAHNTRIVFTNPGYYNIQFSIQLANFATSDDNVTLWFKKEGVDIANSAGVVTVPAKHGSIAGATIASWNFVLDLTAGQYVELCMSSDSGDTVAVTYPAGTSPAHPVSPSVILTATFVSAL